MTPEYWTVAAIVATYLLIMTLWVRLQPRDGKYKAGDTTNPDRPAATATHLPRAVGPAGRSDRFPSNRDFY